MLNLCISFGGVTEMIYSVEQYILFDGAPIIWGIVQRSELSRLREHNFATRVRLSSNFCSFKFVSVCTT